MRNRTDEPGCHAALTDFTEENGATRVVPESHRTGASSLDEKEAEQAVSVELKLGDLLIWDSNLWHGGGANRTDSRRIGLLTFWLVGWVRPDDNLLLLLPREKIAGFPRCLQELVGFRAYQGASGLVAGYDPMSILDPEGGYTEYSQHDSGVYGIEHEKITTTELFRKDG